MGVVAALFLLGVLLGYGVADRMRRDRQVENAKKEIIERQKEELKAAFRAKEDELNVALRAKFKPLPLGWARLEVDELRLDEHGRVAISIVYSKQPNGYAEVQADTTKVVRVILGWIQSQKIDPVKQSLTVSASAILPEAGETGKKLVRFMGKSTYLGITDQIEFKKKLSLQ